MFDEVVITVENPEWVFISCLGCSKSLIDKTYWFCSECEEELAKQEALQPKE